jgi:urease accessory protein
MDSLLLLLLDSRSPAGAHGHSGGMEAAVTAGFVRDERDVQRFCAGRLATAGPVAAGFAAAAARAWLDGADAAAWRALDDEYTARMPSEAARASSRALGRGLLRLLRATVPDVDPGSVWSLVERPGPHQPLVLGAACVIAGGTPALAARAGALGTCTVPASAAVRLLGLDPYAVHRVLAGLASRIDRVADTAAIPADLSQLPAGSAPALELLADVHVTREVRLFAS